MQKDDTFKLRQSAESCQWFQCEQGLKRLLALLKPAQIVTLAASQLTLHLPSFEHHHPDITWPREFLSQFLRPPSPEQNYIYAFPFWSDNYPTPGTNAFMEAMGLLVGAAKAVNLINKSFTIDLAGDAIASVIHVRGIHYWASKHVEQWNKLTSTESIAIALADKEVRQYEKDMWFSVADILQNHIDQFKEKYLPL